MGMKFVSGDLDLWPWHSNSSQRGVKHIFHVNFMQIRSAVPEIFHHWRCQLWAPGHDFQQFNCFQLTLELLKVWQWLCAAACPNIFLHSATAAAIVQSRLHEPCSVYYFASLHVAWVVDNVKYIVDTRVCLCVCLSAAACPRYCTDPDVTWNGRGTPLVVHYWADLQSVYGMRCYDNIARMRNVSECLYSLYAWFCATKKFQVL